MNGCTFGAITPTNGTQTDSRTQNTLKGNRRPFRRLHLPVGFDAERNRFLERRRYRYYGEDYVLRK